MHQTGFTFSRLAGEGIGLIVHLHGENVEDRYILTLFRMFILKTMMTQYSLIFLMSFLRKYNIIKWILNQLYVIFSTYIVTALVVTAEVVGCHLCRVPSRVRPFHNIWGIWFILLVHPVVGANEVNPALILEQGSLTICLQWCLSLHLPYKLCCSLLLMFHLIISLQY